MKRNPNQFSNSKIATYQQCPFKYKLQYLTDTESSFDTIEAFMGQRVHDSLEKLYLDLQMAKLLSLDQLLSFYNEIWNKHWNENIHIVKKEYTKDDYRYKGEECLKNFYNRYAPFNQDKTIALEKIFNFKINEKYTILGFIDRLAKTEDGAFVIHDYKTSNTLPTQEQIDSDRQLPLYRLGVKALWPDVKEIRLVYHYLTFDIELTPSCSITIEDEEKMKDELIESIKQIESTEEYNPVASNLCNWCEYQPDCPKRKHIFKVESIPSEIYHDDDGVKLVDRYVEVWTKEQEIKKAQEEIKNRLFEYAKKENVEAMKGSNYKIYVKAKVEKTFPNRDDPGRKELEDLLKKSGIWEEVSYFSPYSLKQRLTSGGLNQDLANKITPYQIEKENNWVSQPYKLKFS
ncbi:MAG: PD-(D/E)XK nuclease family protein [Deltaproteobacteria bacterium]|nr:PD-(D/E)XK nuclease family protein [Deltaproteobacteria bacterium]